MNEPYIKVKMVQLHPSVNSQTILARSLSIQDLRNRVGTEFISERIIEDEIGRREAIVWRLPEHSYLRQEVLAGMAE